MSRTAIVYIGSSESLDELRLPTNLRIVSTAQGPSVGAALQRIAAGEAAALVLPRLRAGAASLSDLIRLVDWLTAAGADLIACDVGLDTGTAQGGRMVSLLREIDSWGRDAERPGGPRGRPGLGAHSPDLAGRIAELRERGLTLQAIAAKLNEEGVPDTARRGHVEALQRAVGARLPPSPSPDSGRATAPTSRYSRQTAWPSPPEAAMTTIIEQLGVLGVFLLMVPESACIPVPSEVTLLFSGFAVSQNLMSLPLAILAATAGNLVGSLIAYAIGATHVLDQVPGARALLARSDRMLDDRGMRAVFIARLLPLARTFVSLPAGARRLPLAPFIALTAARVRAVGRRLRVLGDGLGNGVERGQLRGRKGGARAASSSRPWYSPPGTLQLASDSSWEITCRTALISARWVNACG